MDQLEGKSGASGKESERDGYSVTLSNEHKSSLVYVRRRDLYGKVLQVINHHWSEMRATS